MHRRYRYFTSSVRLTERPVIPPWALRSLALSLLALILSLAYIIPSWRHAHAAQVRQLGVSKAGLIDRSDERYGVLICDAARAPLPPASVPSTAAEMSRPRSKCLVSIADAEE